MIVTMMATPMTMRGLSDFLAGGFSAAAGGLSLAGSGAFTAGSSGGAGDGVGAAWVVIGRRREQLRAVSAALLAGTEPGLAGEIQLVGSTRGQMLANNRADRAAKSHVYTSAKAFVIRRPPGVNVRACRPARTAGGLALKCLLERRLACHAAKPDMGRRGVLRLR